MSFNVRIFGHRGTRQLQQVIPTQYTSNISEALVQPYDWAQEISTSGGTPVLTQIVGPNLFGFNDLATVVMIEIPDGQTIRYEFNTPNRSGGYMINGVLTPITGIVNAGNQSPRLAGVNVFSWTPGTVISIVEGPSFP